MAVQRKKKLLLLDEPTATLDPTNASIVMEFIQELIDSESLTVLMICHDQILTNRYRTGSVFELYRGSNDIREIKIINATNYYLVNCNSKLFLIIINCVRYNNI